ncbi:MAG: alkaline phosphatase D family protein [Akkermansiaceae bacterium]
MLMKHIISKILLSSVLLSASLRGEAPYFASGIKVGEVDQDSAIVWMRLTEEKEADFGKLPIFTEGLKLREKDKNQAEMPVGVVPGAAGEGRVVYWKKGAGDVKFETEWVEVTEERDFSHQFELEGLEANVRYELVVEARKGDDEVSTAITGGFKTAPASEQVVPVSFIVTTCQAVRSIDSGKEGHIAYKHMLDYNPDFFVHTGDILYYDKAPICKNVEQARAKWDLMFSYGYNREFHRFVSSYFMKDDHDTLKDDAYPGMIYGDLTFEKGLEIFREQVPMGDKTYRTIRWGKDVQVWLTENRDFRSKNFIKDGPEKTILGEEQKAWLKKTIEDSDATYKFIITPGPMVGPDKKGKTDNHSNAAFAHEGQELRDFVAEQKNLYVICGDRHWQYCSKDPKTGVLEMGCGPINDQHIFGGSSGENVKFHRYFSEKGGFLAITVVDGKAKAEWYTSSDVDAAGKPKVGYTEQLGE